MSSVSIANMRAYLYLLYPSKTWARRVDRMGDAQIIAIYKSHMEQDSVPKTKNVSQDETLF